jgi:hypothetical protein
MPSANRSLGLSLAGLLILAGAAALATPSPAGAQCGSQSSSCKNCHEVQAEFPVNASGDWHVSHAFGDFCEFCHGGNVQAMDADAAHQGMVEPLTDPTASCSACHPADARQLALVYGAALGVEVGEGTLAASPADATASLPAAAPAAASATDCDELPPAGRIDYNALYAETVQGRRPISTGNLVLGVTVGGLVLAGGGFVVWNERRRRPKAMPALEPEAQAPSASSPLVADEAASVLAAIGSLEPPARRALQQLLRDPKSASDLLSRLAEIDPEVIRSVRNLKPETRALLLALTSD